MAITMKIKPEALEIIKKKMDDQHQVILLALNDGSNKYSKEGGTCTIGASFQLLILEKEDPEYNIKIENNAGLKIFTAEPETGFIEENVVINARNATLSLSDDSGLIDGAVTVKQYEPEAVTKDDLINGGKC